MKKTFLLMTAIAALAWQGTTAFADPAKAEDEAYNLAVRYAARGYAISPTNTNGVGGAGYTVKFLIPVSKGLDYVFLAGVDQFVRESNIYVYDEVGDLILDDRRGGKYSGVKFRSSYTGTVLVYFYIVRCNGFGAYSVLVGRRGEQRPGEEPPSVAPPAAP